MKLFPAQKKAFTLIELLIVIALIGVIIFPLLLSYNTYRTTQALAASADAVANRARSAHIFSRESRNQREWGIKNRDDRLYYIYSFGSSGIVEEQNYSLDGRVTFEEDFDVLFEIGTGDTDSEATVKLINSNGRRMWVTVSKNGVVEVNVDP